MVTESDVKKMVRAKDISGLIKSFENENQDVRTRAANAIVDIGKTAVDHLIEALGNKNSNIRGVSATVLGMIGDKRAIDPLIKLFDDEDEDVGYGARSALEEIGKPAVKPLIEALSGEGISRFYSIQILGNIGDKRAVEPLIEALNDKDMDVVFVLIVALGNIKDVLAVEPLIKKIEDLKDEHWGLRLYVTAALVKIGIESANIDGPHIAAQKVYEKINGKVRNSLLEGELGNAITFSGLMSKCEYKHGCRGEPYFYGEIKLFTPTESPKNAYMYEEGYDDDEIYCEDCTEYLPSKKKIEEGIYHPNYPDLGVFVHGYQPRVVPD